MNTLKVDVAVIGAGSAGLTAYRAAKSHGKRVVLIEGGPYGTTCARVGCMPSKLLIAAAEAAHALVSASGFGVHAGPVRVDGKAVMARVRSERDRFVDFVIDSVNRISPSDLVHGYARFIDRNRLQVDDHTVLHADNVVIATGSSPEMPPRLAGLGDRLLVNDHIFELEDLPDSVAVIGTGIIGVELGQALHRLGVQVTLFGRSGSIANLSDPVVRDATVSVLRKELDLHQHAELLDARRDDDAVVLRMRNADQTEVVRRYSYVLAATGRIPNVNKLDLENTGLALDKRGLPLFDPYTMQCGDSNIFIAGDVNAERPLLHEAADQGRIAGDNAGRFPDVRRGLRRAPLAIAFSDPQIAIVGQSYRTLPLERVAIGEVLFEDQGRSRVMLQNRGVLRVYGEYGSGLFIGAEMIAPRAEHLAHLLSWACQSRMTVAQMLDMPFYHPVIEEGVRTALRSLNEALMNGPPAVLH